MMGMSYQQNAVPPAFEGDRIELRRTDEECEIPEGALGTVTSTKRLRKASEPAMWLIRVRWDSGDTRPLVWPNDVFRRIT